MPFGGIFPVIRKFSTVENMIDAEFGVRARHVGYQYGEILRTMMCNYLCSGDRVEDIKIYQQGIEYMPGMKLCSPDTVLRAINELTEKDIVYEAESGKSYSFNAAERLNTVMVKAAIAHRLIRPGRQYILDFYHEFMEAEKYDALHTYKGLKGYSPGVAVLTDKVTGDDVIIGVENRDGNANVKFHQEDTLNRIFARLDAQGIWTMIIRCDCGSYSKEIIEAIQNHIPAQWACLL